MLALLSKYSCYAGRVKETINNYREKVDKKLVNRQRIFFVIIFILLTIDVINVIEKKMSVVLAVSGFLLATMIGLSLSRMFKIFWHEEKQKVVSQLDTIGTVLLVLYIGVEVGRNWIFGYWLSGAALTAFGLIVLTGLLLGRFLGTFIKINKALLKSKDFD